MIKVFKFGGASVKDADAVRNMAHIVARHAPQSRLLVVVSAMGKMTNALEDIYNAYVEHLPAADRQQRLDGLRDFHLQIARALFEDPGHPVFELLDNLLAKLVATLDKYAAPLHYDEGYDQVISFGEVLSTHIVSQYLNHIQIPTRWVDSRKYIQTNSNWRDALVDWNWTETRVNQEVRRFLEREVVLTQGFIGGTIDGRTTTLGREGSDFTAAIYAATLRAESVTIWKDVPGVLNADPKRVSDTQLYPQISYQEAAEMTYYGATVIHPKTIKPLANHAIALHVRSFVQSEAPGTVIHHTQPAQMMPAIIFKPNQRLIAFCALDFTFISEPHISRILEALVQVNLRANLMQMSAISFSVCVDNVPRKVDRLMEGLRGQFQTQAQEGLELVTIKHPNETTIAQIVGTRPVVLRQITSDTYQAILQS